MCVEPAQVCRRLSHEFGLSVSWAVLASVVVVIAGVTAYRISRTLTDPDTSRTLCLSGITGVRATTVNSWRYIYIYKVFTVGYLLSTLSSTGMCCCVNCRLFTSVVFVPVKCQIYTSSCDTDKPGYYGRASQSGGGNMSDYGQCPIVESGMCYTVSDNVGI